MRRLRTHLLLAMGCVLASAPVRAQLDALHPTEPLPSFEVATIKPRDPMVPLGMRIGLPGTSQRAIYVGTLRNLIRQAYSARPDKRDDRVTGGPDWLQPSSTKEYLIEGKIPDDIFIRMQTMTSEDKEKIYDLMMQSLLVERFKLKVHFERREALTYDLVVARSGAKLTKTTDTTRPSGTWMVKGGMDGTITAGGQNVTLDTLAVILGQVAERPAVNKTGIEGRYDLPLKFSIEGTQFEEAFRNMNIRPSMDAPSLSGALKAYGLELKPSKAMQEFVVIDSIESPTAN